MEVHSQVLLRYITMVVSILIEYTVIDLLIEQCVSMKLNIIDDALLIGWNNEPHNTNDLVDNDVDDVVQDVSEDEWLKESLMKLGRLNTNVGQSCRNESINVDNVEHDGNEESENSKHKSDNEDNEFIADEENMIHDVEEDMQEFRSNIYAN
ncbi:hypothetical protein Tco_0613004 [Tanacetum coccineum]